MGYSFCLPLIVKTRKWGWVVMVSSGYNNITSSVTANRGKGFLYILNVRTGALLQKIATPAGTETDPSGFMAISGYTPSFADYTTDEVYGGDLFGNLWRFDLRSPSAAVPAPLLFATLKDPSGVAQPITTLPLIEYSVNDGLRYVFVGTGRFLDASDIQNPQQQTFYAIRDGTIAKRFEATASATGVALPSGVSFPITRADLFNHSDISLTSNLAIGLTATEIASKPMGWYYNTGGFAPASGTVTSRERITLNPKASQGFVTWVGSVPDVNACNPNGLSRQYATTYGGGASLLYTSVIGTNTSTTNVRGGRTFTSFIETSALVKSQLVNVSGGVRILGTDAKGKPFLIGNPLNAFGAGRLLNWREVLQ
jgi:type IV pilus assembly protein PilY1